MSERENKKKIKKKKREREREREREKKREKKKKRKKRFAWIKFGNTSCSSLGRVKKKKKKKYIYRKGEKSFSGSNFKTLQLATYNTHALTYNRNIE